MKTYLRIVIVVSALVLFTGSAHPGTRIKDIAYVNGIRGRQLIGYGLVVGLNGSGDTQRATFTLQSVTSMLKRFGITVPQADLRLRNVAAVMVTATVPTFAREGGVVDVIASSMGDATSLQGGTLLMTPLSSTDGVVYAMAQGPLSVGGMSVRAGGSEMRRNHTAAARVPGGGILERGFTTPLTGDSSLVIILMQADFTTALRVAEAVNAKYAGKIAYAMDAATIAITIPQQFRVNGGLVEFIATTEGLELTPDVAAKVVINERTGTIVIGGNVSILPVAISHGGLNIEIQSVPIVSQPNPFSQGQTVVAQLMTVAAAEDTSTVTAIEGTATVQDVARALNSLKIAPRDIIAVFQALKEAGALKALLVII